MRRLWIGVMTVALMIVGGTFTLANCAENPPDFNNPESVQKDIRTKIDACSAARARNCMVSCGYASKTLKNFIKANPEGDPSIMKQRWQPCYEAHRDADLPEPAAAAAETAKPAAKPVAAKAKPAILDPGKFVVSGLQLGGEMDSQKSRLTVLEAYGYHAKTKKEYNDVVLSRGTTQPGPDIIQNYKGLIKEAPVYVHFEATSEGRVYQIQFEQKEDMDVKKVEAALIDRYGKPTKHQGRYLIWGCNQGHDKGVCVKANPSDRSLTIWALDADLKAAAHKAYRQNVLKAKGVKSGAKF